MVFGLPVCSWFAGCGLSAWCSAGGCPVAAFCALEVGSSDSGPVLFVLAAVCPQRAVLVCFLGLYVMPVLPFV